MRTVLCGCGRRLEGKDDGELFGRTQDHLRRDHSAVAPDNELVRGFVARAYEVEYAMPYTNGGGPLEEGFGPEPY